jgi:hypothetical protein
MKNTKLYLWAGCLILLTFSFSAFLNAGNGIVLTTSFDEGIQDNNRDGMGDKFEGQNATSIRVGEFLTDTNDQRDWVGFSFDKNAQKTITESPLILLDLSLLGKSSVVGYNANIVGLSNRTSVKPKLSDYMAPGLLVSSNAFTTSSLPGRYEFDVTSFVKGEVNASSNNVVNFRVEIPSGLPNFDGKRNSYILGTSSSSNVLDRPMLTIMGTSSNGF